MTYLTDLATAARASGLTVVEVAGWKTRGHGGMTSVKGIVCHWTATTDSAKGDYPSLGIVRDGRSDLPGPLCNLGLGRSGTVYVVAAGLAYHAGAGYWPGIGSNGNANMIGIEAEENGDSNWTPAMLAAYPRLCAALRAHYGFPVGNVIGHHEWAPGRKIDIKTWPGGMTAFRRAVNNPTTEEDGFLAALSDAAQKQLDALIRETATKVSNIESFVEPGDDWTTRVHWLELALSDMQKDHDKIMAQLAAIAKKLGA